MCPMNDPTCNGVRPDCKQRQANKFYSSFVNISATSTPLYYAVQFIVQYSQFIHLQTFLFQHYKIETSKQINFQIFPNVKGESGIQICIQCTMTKTKSSNKMHQNAASQKRRQQQCKFTGVIQNKQPCRNINLCGSFNGSSVLQQQLNNRDSVLLARNMKRGKTILKLNTAMYIFTYIHIYSQPHKQVNIS